MTKLTKKYWLGLCLLLGLLVILLPSQTATAADKQTLNVQLSHDLISLDSAQATDQTSFDIMENAFEAYIAGQR
ncbi:hypothetical protein JCM14202_1693 [Agrilactobacillus composti DSM 18527 = JCM 14202]|uniref:hypothetical protein n=1 Tax=Agrilactobacillus composti TaxID=398555 RepID=UPI00042DFDBC|nr:hypothetical protein [Agrilactobacillus composti]GAF39817.1 hypothetical protein JCM14202_1693 [Agrilactobacillus composti DSM 18527 = JCM 14202]